MARQNLKGKGEGLGNKIGKANIKDWKDQKLLKNLEEIEGPAKSNDLNSTNRNLVEHKGTKKLKRPQNHVTPHTSIIPHEKGKDHRP